MVTNYNSDIINLMAEQFATIMSEDSEYYGKYNIVLSNEQQFVKQKDRNPNTIYIVVKFLKATLFYGQTIAPVTINAVGEENNIEVCQHLMLEYAQTFNLNDDNNINGDLVKQFYDSPQVINNFNEVNKGFRTLFYMGGTFLIGEQSNPIASITVDMGEGEDPYDIKFLSAHWSWDNQLDSQAYTTTNNRTKSEAKISTLTLSVVMYQRNDAFCNIILGMAFNSLTFAPLGNRTTFKLSITFKGEDSVAVTDMPFKVANVTGQQNIGEFPSMSITFTN